MMDNSFSEPVLPYPRHVPIIFGNEERRITVAEIVGACADFAHLKVSAMLSPRRQKYLSRPRQAAMYLAAMHTERSLPDIGKRCGGRDHSTVVHARDKVMDDLKNGGKVFGEIVTHVERQLGLE